MIQNLLTNPEFNNTPIFFEHARKLGYTKQLFYKYVKSGWLEKLGHGVYKKSNEILYPMRIIWALQNHLQKKQVYISLYSALSDAGIVHNLRYKERLYISMHNPCFKDRWVLNYQDIKWYKINLFTNAELHIVENDKGVRSAAPERALIELVSLLPKKADFEEICNLLTIATTLRAKVIQELLENCTDFKTKRLFLFIAKKIDAPWLNRLSIGNIDLGKGRKQIGSGGIIDKDFNIILPKEWKNAAFI